ncbi:hypothetical protein V6N11_047065 [Hibiscus sabdariffa]|uniref:Uncharacterized protein n=1 Tax=Hibiscus sabdariffa TaxID=183260 RepID=A0ABR1ZXX0_9ROSI
MRWKYSDDGWFKVNFDERNNLKPPIPFWSFHPPITNHQSPPSSPPSSSYSHRDFVIANWLHRKSVLL